LDNTFKDLFGKIPHVWFDLYARFLPGMVAVALFFAVLNEQPTPALLAQQGVCRCFGTAKQLQATVKCIPIATSSAYAAPRPLIVWSDSAGRLVILALIAFLIGHLFQPMSSAIANCCPFFFNSNRKKCRNDQIVSKAYAEMIGMLSTAIVTLVMLILALVLCTAMSHCEIRCCGYLWLSLVGVFSVFGALERRCAMNRKIRESLAQQLKSTMSLSHPKHLSWSSCWLFRWHCERKIRSAKAEKKG